MIVNPFLGVVFHWLGGLASGSFYVPFRGVRKWAWEVYWLVGGFFSWIIAPIVLASVQTEDLWAVIVSAPPASLIKAYVFGALWGVGGLTFGLTMRYLGMSLGMGVALGYCAVVGTLVPPIVDGTFGSQVLGTTSGLVILIGILVCVLGIVIAGMAGMSKEREMSEEAKKSSIKEFNFGKGILVAAFSGVFSACMAFGLAAAEPVARISAEHGTDPIWVGLPKLCIVLLGGFTTNFIWCLILNRRNKTGNQYFRSRGQAPMLRNYFFSALAGTVWYFQFFFYTMGETQMGRYKFSSWTIHMASIILFSSLWGLALKEWKGASGFTKTLLIVGLAVLIFSTLIVGYGNYLAAQTAPGI
ncbi:MAG: L-rhamnose/proton symporter RhaT [Candidatus Aminicenantes bacterium]|nr:L-rhamnose/proton symporter RhaT [Candidatus Aminicenantes bacterium]